MGKFKIGQVYKYSVRAIEVEIIDRTAKKITVKQDGEIKHYKIRQRDNAEWFETDKAFKGPGMTETVMISIYAN